MNTTDIILFILSIIGSLSIGMLVGDYLGKKLAKSIEEYFKNKIS